MAQPDQIVPESGGKEMWRSGPITPDFEHREVLPLLTCEAVAYVDEHANDDSPFYLYPDLWRHARMLDVSQRYDDSIVPPRSEDKGNT